MQTIVIKGPEEDVDSAIAQIQTMVDEVHNSVIDIKVKPEFHKYLIGKKRANVKRVSGFILYLIYVFVFSFLDLWL